MEPLDPPKNIEGSRLSRRRISSILKAPRKSSVFHDTEQEENEVERTKPVEKRNSRRVSFAPANDVLLFDKDVKNASPARSPLQELAAAMAATTQNRVQVAVTDERSQQIMGIENLLNAPLHTSQQRNLASFDIGSGFGEKTVMFSTEDAVMDFTQNHTITISTDSDADLLGDPSRQNVLLTRGEGRTAGDVCQSAPLSSDGNKDSEPLLELDFENFLASLSKPSGSDRTAALTEPTSEERKSKTQMVDKENQVPKSLSSYRNVGEPLNHPEDDVNVDQTEACAERTLGGGDGDDDDPFRCLFPTQDMYAQRDRRSSQTRRKCSGADATKDLGKQSLMNLPVHTPRESHKETLVTADDRREKTVRFSADDITQSHTSRFTTNDAGMGVTPSQTGYIDLNSQLRQSLNFSLASREKTVGFVADEATMEITQCLTANIESNSASDSALYVGERDEMCDPQQNRSSVRHGLNTGIINLLTNTNVNPKMTSEGYTICPDDDVCMDITEAQTGYILEGCVNRTEDQMRCFGEDGHLQSLLHTQRTHPQSGNLRKEIMTTYQQPNEGDGSSAYKETSVKSSLKTVMQRHQVAFDAEDDSREKTVRFSASDASMDVTRSHAVDIIRGLSLSSFPIAHFPADETKTVRFAEDDADMEVTQSHTVNVSVELNVTSDQNVSLVPANGEKTVRFTTNDGDMDVTRMDAANISTGFEPRSRQNAAFHPLSEDKTVRFTTNDASIEMTNCFTVNIDNNPASGLDLIDKNVVPDDKNESFHPPSGDRTVRFTTNDASIEMTNCFTVNIDNNPASGLDLIDKNVVPDDKNESFHPPSGDRTVRFTTNDASIEMTNCFTVNIDNNPASGLDLMNQNFVPDDKKESFPSAGPLSDSFSSAHLEQELKSSVSRRGVSLDIFKAEVADTPQPQETAESNGFQLKTQKRKTNAENESPSLVSVVAEQPGNEMMTSCAETESGCLRPASPGNISSTQDNSVGLKKTGLDLQNSETLGLPTPDDVDSNKMEATAAESFPPPQKMEPGDAEDVDASSSRTSRRKSLADLQSKLKRLSNVLKAAPDSIAIDGSTTTLPQQVDPDPDQNSKDKATSLPEAQPELQTGLMNAENDTGSQSRLEKFSSAANATPFKLKTQQLMSRLSVGGFKPKLPQRKNPEESKKLASAGEATRTFTDGITSRLRDFDHDIDDVFNEELGSCEDMSEMLDTRTPEKIPENEDPSKEFYMFDPLEDDFFKEPFASPFHQKRPLPEGEGDKNDEKKLKMCTEVVEMEFQPVVERDAYGGSAQMTTQTIDSSNSSRYEAASESTFKPSLFESQLEDYSSDGQKKLKDGTITVMEFFNLFNIDFVTHNPRQSVLPDRFSSDADVTPLDLLRNKHINRPRRKIYEADIQILTTQVEELKVRLQDLNKPLRTVNRCLWEEMRHFSEKELKSFGAKLKERNNFFRKTSKVQSHQMKEVLYVNLVRVNQEEQQKLRGLITKADTMLKCLDDCVSGLEAEISAVMEKDTEDKKCIKTLQEEFTKTSEALAENNRQISELEQKKKQNSSKLNKLKTETTNLKSHIDTLNMLNEWRLREKDGRTSFTFLHDTIILELLYEKLEGNDADSRAEKITNINFKFDLDDETSQFHARLVHKLLSQHIKGESAWVEKYPTSRHVPKLLHDVSLMVSPCRLLGEELRRLKMWGALRFDILDISSTETQVRVVFSSLKKMSKFEVVFSVSLTNQLCVFQVQSFKNKFGNTTIQQIEEIVASLTSNTKLFTEIITKIHDTLLC